jgi:O-antigen/teichoic acid export membrane protein
VITAIVAWFISSKFILHINSSLTNLDLKSIFREALPYALTIFLMYMYTRSDSVLIEQLLPDGTTEVGVYAAGFRLLDAANMIAFLFGPLLIPMYVRLRKDKNETIQLMQLASGMMIFMTALISIGSFFWASDIILLCYGHNEETWVMPFRFLILNHIPIGLMYIFSSYLTAMKQMNQQNKLFVISVLINLGLNFILIPMWGILGAAVTMLITQTVTTLGLIFLSHNFLREKLNVSIALRSVIYIFILIGAGYFLEGLQLSWLVEITCFSFIALLAAFLLKLLQWQSFLDVIRKRQQVLS